MRRFILGCYYAALIALLISIGCFAIGIASVMIHSSSYHEEIHREVVVENAHEEVSK